MTVRVFHYAPFGKVFSTNHIQNLPEMIRDGEVVYEHVADVLDTDDMEHAYTLTNTINHDWWTNMGIDRKFKHRACRSTSVGDIMVVNGRVYAVAPMGMQELPATVLTYLFNK